MLVAGGRARSAYRGTAIDEAALWTVVHDNDAGVEARARVLATSPDPAVRVRVASVVEELPTEAVRMWIGIAMKPDAEEAAAELEALDLEELRRKAGV